MSAIVVYPTRGFLNTTFKIKASQNDTFKITFNGNTVSEGKLSIGETVCLPKLHAAGDYMIESIKSGERQAIRVEDAYRFGGSKLNYAFLAKYSTTAFIVMLDRLYTYNYENQDFWMDNNLCPDSIEDLNAELFLFKSKRKSESDEKTTLNDYYSVFSLVQKRILFSFNELIAYTPCYLVYRDIISKEVSIYFYTIDLFVSIEMEKSIFDSQEDCLYYTIENDEDIYKTSNLNEWETRQLCLNAHTNGDEIDIDDCFTIYLDNSLTTCCYKVKSGKFIEFSGAHYAIFNNKFVDLRTKVEKSIPYAPNIIINGNNDSLQDNLQILCADNQQFLFAGRKQNAYMTILYKDIKTYATNNNLYWIEKDCILYNDAYGIKSKVQHCILHPLYSIHWNEKDTEKIHLAPDTRICVNDVNSVYVSSEDTSFYIDNENNIVEELATTSSLDMEKNRPFPGTLCCRKMVAAWEDGVDKDVIVVKNGCKYSIGIWVNQLNRYVTDESVDDFIDKSSYGNAMFFANGGGVLIKDNNGKQFQWMDNSGKLQNIEFDNTSFIIKGINGYLPLVSFDSSRRPVFVDPVTSNIISPSYLRDYVFSSPDKSLYARNNHLEDIKYICESTGKEISFDEYRKLFFDYNYPEYVKECKLFGRCPDIVLRNNSIKHQDSEIIKENRKRFIKEHSISFDRIEKFYASQDFKLHTKWLDEAIEEISECKYIDFVKIIASPKQYITIFNAEHKIHERIFVGEPLWFLNYVSFSYDNRFVAISGRYPDGSNSGGLLFVHDLLYKRTAFDSTHESKASYNAVWLSSFDKNGNIASYTSEPITRILSLNKDVYNVNEILYEKNFLTYSRSGKFSALSDQGYIRYDNSFTDYWGHKPSCNIYIRNEITKRIIGPFNDFGISSHGKKNSIVGTGEREESVSSVSFSADEKQYLAVSSDGVIIVRNIQEFDK